MITEIRMPKLGMTQENVKIVKWLKANGEHCEKDEAVVIVETAKVTHEIEAPASGFVWALRQVNDKVDMGDVLGLVADSKEALEAYKDQPAQDSEATSTASGTQKAESGSASVAANPGVSAAPPADGRIAERIPFSGIRRSIADNLVGSLQTGAQLTITTTTDLTELSAFRHKLMHRYEGEKITFVDMLAKILATVLKEFPILNSTLRDDEIICWDACHIGIAVAIPNGLVVPVVRDADQKSLLQISREIRELSLKARNNELTPENYSGGTFTLSSGGKVEVEIITPIINPPQNAILAIGKIGPKPAVHGNKLAIRTMTHLCLTHDHRVIDGVPAGQFLGRLKELLEQSEEFRKILE